jgi:hypothetical protein
MLGGERRAGFVREVLEPTFAQELEAPGEGQAEPCGQVRVARQRASHLHSPFGTGRRKFRSEGETALPTHAFSRVQANRRTRAGLDLVRDAKINYPQRSRT